MSKNIFFIIFLMLTTVVFGQDKAKIDSLNLELINAQQDTSHVNIYIELGNLYLNKDSTLSTKYFQKANHILENHKSKHFKAQSLSKIAKCYMENFKYSQSIKYNTLAVNLLKEINQSELLMDTYNEIGKAYFYLSNYSKSIAYFQNSYNVSKEINDVKYMAKTLSNLGSLHNTIGEYDKALSFFDKAIESNKTVKSEKALILAYLNVGNTYLYLGNYEKANSYYQASLKLAEQKEDRKNIPYALTNLANIQALMENYTEAIEYNKKALTYADNDYESVPILTSIGNQYLSIGNDSLAIVYSKRGLKAAQIIGNKYHQANSLYILGTIYLNKNELLTALKYLEDALLIHKETDHKEGISKCYYQIALLNFKMNKAREALKYANKGLNINLEINRAEGLMLDYKQLSEINVSIGNYKEAYLNQIKFKKFHDSIYSNEKVKNIIAMEMQFNFDKEKEIAKLEQQKKDALQIETSRRQKTVRNSFIVGFILMALLTLFILRSFIQKHKSNRLLAKQKEEIESQAKDLKTINAKLLDLDKFKQGMTGMIVHDLKNPLNNIINLSNDPNAKQYGEQMLNMVLNILDVYKYKETQFTVDKINYSLYELASNAINKVQFLAKQKNIKITNKFERKLGIKCDKDITERIFVNLLTNAIKYTPNNGDIELKTQNNQEKGFIRVVVSDSGQGIPKESLSKVFEKFGQASAKKSGNIRSTGLGLTFCKMAVEAHGGEINVESEINKGTSFYFTLPVGSEIKNINLQPETQEKSEGLILSATDKKLLEPYIQELNKFMVYQTSSIERILTEINSKNNKPIQAWIVQVQDCLFTMNEEKFKELISI